MSLVLTNNIASLTAQNNLSHTSMMLATTLQRLSSGLKINSGADGPAALVISEQQRAQMAGLQAGIANTAKATSMVQTADGALNEVDNLLTQIRSLAVDSANSGVYDPNALAANQAQVSNGLATIDRIAATSQFGVKKLLDGSAGLTGTTDNANATFINAVTGAPTGNFAINITAAATRANTTAGSAQGANALATNETLTINGVAIQLTAGQTQAQVINAINQYTGQTGVTAVNNAGSTQLYTSQFGSNSTITVQSNVAAATTSSGFGTTQTTVHGTDIAGTLGGFAAAGNGNVLTGSTGAGAAGISVVLALAGGSNTTTVAGAQGNVTVTSHALVFQIGANSGQTASIAIDNVATSALGLNVAGVQFASLNQINVQSQSGAQDAIKIIDQAISQVSDLQGRLGAFQTQTLQSTANSMQTSLQNTTSAESVIRDTDFAAETANLSKFQVLSQAGTSVLTAANQSSQLILRLFQ